MEAEPEPEPRRYEYLDGQLRSLDGVRVEITSNPQPEGVRTKLHRVLSQWWRGTP